MKKSISAVFTTYRGLPKEIYILFAARVINCIGSFIFPLLTLILTQKLGMSKTETGNYIALLTCTQAPCLFLGGKLTDTIGRKKVLILSQMFGSAAYLACGLTGNHHSLLVLIIIASNLFVLASPAYQAMLADLTTPENRKESFSLLYLGVNIGMAISPILGGLLFQNYLSLLFILDAATTLFSSLLIALFVKEVHNPAPQGMNAAGVREYDGRISVFRVLKSVPVLTFFILFMFTYHFTYSQWGFLLPLQFGDLYGGNGARFYSLLNTLNAALVVFCTPLLTRFTVRFQSLAVVAGGGILYFFSFLAFAVFRSMMFFVLSSIVFTIAEIITTIHIGTFIADHSPSAHLGRINSIATFTQGTANALAPMLMGYVLSATSYFWSWLLIAALILTGAVSMLGLSKKERKMALQLPAQTAGQAAD